MGDSIIMMESCFDEEEVRPFRPLPPGKAYHVFLSYRDVDGDRQWVQELQEKLETTYKLKCCNHLRDFRPGRKITDNIKDAIISSVKTLIILSKDYHKSFWCTYEAEYTHQLSMELREKIILPVLKEDCDIPDHMKPFTYIDARGPIHQWLPILVSTIEEPVGGTIDSKYSQLDFNSRYRNFDTVHVEKTVFRCCGSPSTLPFEPRGYLPDSLNSKVYNITFGQYQDILSVISSTFLIRCRHTGQPWLPTILCFIIPMLIFLILMISFCIEIGLELSGNRTELASQIMQHKINYHKLDKPLSATLRWLKLPKTLQINVFFLIVKLIVFILVFVLIIGFVIKWAVHGKCMVQVMDKLYEASPDFVWDIDNNKIEYTTSGKHSNRLTCLCKYILKREESKQTEVETCH